VSSVKILLANPGLDRKLLAKAERAITHLGGSGESYENYRRICESGFRFTMILDDEVGCGADSVTFNEGVAKYNDRADTIARLLKDAQATSEPVTSAPSVAPAAQAPAAAVNPQ
jgi:hypothetical protein